LYGYALKPEARYLPDVFPNRFFHNDKGQKIRKQESGFGAWFTRQQRSMPERF
jgi:hypothetical protein